MVKCLTCDVQIGTFFFLFTALSIPTASRSYKLIIRKISPDSTYVARREPLKLDVNVTCDSPRRPSYLIYWYFRPFLTTLSKPVLTIHLHNGRRKDQRSYDARFSSVDQASLLLVNTTLDDSGTYWCEGREVIWRYLLAEPKHFNVTVVDQSKAKTTCPSRITLTEKMNLSCWCEGSGGHVLPMASWVKSGKVLHNPTEYKQELSLVNVNKTTTGTYVCRAQFYSFMDEKTTEVTVNYLPRITSFHSQTIPNNCVKLICLADGYPEPTYVIFDSNNEEVPGVINGEVTVRDFCDVVNASFSCVARNNLGKDERRLTIERCSCLTDNNKKKLTSVIKRTEWYYFFISAIIGIILGLGLAYGLQWVRGRVIGTKHSEQQSGGNDVIYAESTPTHQQAPSCPGLHQKPLASSSTDYQEMNAVRPNEENVYQNLQLTTRVKRV